jgi:hypothetical protein
MSVTIDPSVFIKEVWKNGEDGITREQYTEVVLVLNVLKKWEWIKEIEPKQGFTHTNNEIFEMITESIDMSNHTGFTATYMFRTIKKVANVIIVKKAHKCAICLIEDTNEFVMLECSHRFHEECIMYKGFVLCPLCEQNTVPEYFRSILYKK